MNTSGLQAVTSFTCTCVHGGGGHMAVCPLFVPTKEQYAEVVAERDKLRELAKAVNAWSLEEDEATIDAVLDALEKICVPRPGGGFDPPWWMTL